MLIDAHAHFNRPEELVLRQSIPTVFCGANPETAAQVMSLKGEGMYISCGLHPWYADRWTVSDMLPWIQGSVALGEIGLDSVWTDVDMSRQRAVFKAQLELATDLQLPIILHTKGMEAEIARTIAPIPVRKLVHWYSCAEHLEDYLLQDCYFTIGPDHAVNPAVRRVLYRAPLDRVLTETDGLDAVSWALNETAEAADIEKTLRGELRAIAEAHGISEAEAEMRVEANLRRFLTGK